MHCVYADSVLHRVSESRVLQRERSASSRKNRRDGPRCFSPVHSHFVKHCNHHGVLRRTKKSSQLFQPVLTPADIYPCCRLCSDRECVSKLPVTTDWQVEKVRACVCVCVCVCAIRYLWAGWLAGECLGGVLQNCHSSWRAGSCRSLQSLIGNDLDSHSSHFVIMRIESVFGVNTCS